MKFLGFVSPGPSGKIIQMAVMFVAALMMAQAPATVQPATAPPAAKVKKQKSRQICEDVQLTGSRAPRHICHDVNVDAGTLLGVSHSLYGKGTVDSPGGTEAPGSSIPPG